MKLISGAGSLFECRGDYYIVPVFEGEGEGQFKRAVYGALGQRFASLFSKKELAAGYLKKTFISVDAQKALKKVLFIGLGKRKKLDTEKTRQAAGFCVKELRSLGVLSAASFLWDKDEAKKRAQIEGFFLGAYRYANDAKAPKSLVSMEIAGLDGKLGREMNTLLSNVFSTRDMMNAPANIVTPSYIEKKAREAALGRKNLSVRAFGLNEARKMGMGAFCAVAQGSSEPARFIIMEYRGAAKSRKPLVFIGKGITFDSGGISLKPQSSALSKIEDMRYDMSGAAVVLHLLKTLSELKLPVNAVGLLPCTENLPDGGAYKPGDVLKTMSGKTVEVISTDAEGRLVLADAMT
ncbi:MAG TPA: M17 family peptidase N-terminal domain-containing protein, partial [Candidatus Goldiibacteriota bacterium]|nr:M17 family peptidase N-terminal domain-containing protein [Candidatus Goldiibacteriota bacterium]